MRVDFQALYFKEILTLMAKKANPNDEKLDPGTVV